MWWDTRRLGEPTDTLQLATDSKGGGMVLGGSSMEYNQEAGPTKYLVGTEQGIVLQVRAYVKPETGPKWIGVEAHKPYMYCRLVQAQFRKKLNSRKFTPFWVDPEFLHTYYVSLCQPC